MGRPRKDITGQKFNMLTAVKFSHSFNQQSYWVFICECGNEKTIRASKVVSSTGTTKSCGCYRRKHGYCADYERGKLYNTWLNMKARCLNENNHKFYMYGAAGIKICDRWADFKNFAQDMGEPPTKDHSIDRIDSSGDYTPENCRWATKKQQAYNTRGSGSGTSRYKGVSKHGHKWGACIKGNRLGSFESEEDAAKAYDVAAYGLWGNDAYLNFAELIKVP